MPNPIIRRVSNPYTLLDAKATTGAGTAWRVTDYTHLIIEVSTDGGGNADLKVVCRGTTANIPPDFAAAATRANFYTDIALYDYTTANCSLGTAGFDTTGAPGDSYKIYVINLSGMEWVNFVVTSYAAGNVTVIGRGYSNS